MEHIVSLLIGRGESERKRAGVWSLGQPLWKWQTKGRDQNNSPDSQSSITEKTVWEVQKHANYI